jgi:hypothetical protein
MTSTFGRALLVEILFQFDSTVPKDSSLGRLFICTSSSLRMPKPITCVFQLSVRAIALGIATSKVAKLLGSNERFIETHVRRIQKLIFRHGQAEVFVSTRAEIVGVLCSAMSEADSHPARTGSG